ncbi:MAG: glutamine--fructose-6-phosphate transaminase (isomerizing) [Dehalococcoidia bacterium]|nr:glutamine--fructose-6-phosphate transaminase (isomerizing) [Dehalococcoidia bacterium]
MCGIVGYVGRREAAPILLKGLQCLEYRGYDSAGIAVLGGNGDPCVVKSTGKLRTLASCLEGVFPEGCVGIGHTRWATHGKPSDANAHPHLDCSGDVVVIHNGIVENYLTLRSELLAAGHAFRSETDTEVIPHLIEANLNSGLPLVEAVRRALPRLEGAHAILAVSRSQPDRIVAARVGNAGGVVIGYGEGEMFLASDLPALLEHTRRVVFLCDGEVAEVTCNGASFRDRDGAEQNHPPQTVPFDPMAAAKGGYKHFMLKEIMEQPQAVLDTIRGRVQFEPLSLQLEDMPPGEALRRIQRVVLIAMGTSLHAAMVGKHYIEQIAGIAAEVDNASEFRYRNPIIGPETLVISVAQSGETVDTLEAMAEAKKRGALQITVCNTPGSQATRIADGVVYIRCGLEIGVASTKTLLGSIAALYLLACYLGQKRRRLSKGRLEELLSPLARIPQLIGSVVGRSDEYEELAHSLFRCQNFLYLGRGIQYPVAMEGALKLKEVSYIHAEGYPAGEMKHGPIALIDQDMPVILIAVRDGLRDKMISNLQQVRARDGVVIALGNEGDEELAGMADHAIFVPETTPLLMPLLTVVPLQLLAYHIAVRRGCDVDQPRNLAKTVTVE